MARIAVISMIALLHFFTAVGQAPEAYIDLGKFESDFDWNDESKVRSSPFKRHKIQKYHSQTYVNGTSCDILNHKRDTEVRVSLASVYIYIYM